MHAVMGLWYLVNTLLVFAVVFGDHVSDRLQIIEEESRATIGGTLRLETEKEVKVNEELMRYKRLDYERDFKDASRYLGSKHFFESRDSMKESKVFQFIRKMPKGAALHVHDLGIVDVEYVVKNVTYREGLYMCYKNDNLLLKFMKNNRASDCKWKLVREMRENSGNIENFDKELEKHLSLTNENPGATLPNIDVAWNKFQGIFTSIFPMLTYEPVFREYFYEAFAEFYNDNIMYIEMRTVLPNLYDFDREYDEIHTAHVLEEVIKKFKKDHPNFLGVKIIYAPMRNVDPSVVSTYLKTARVLQEQIPEIFAGFDLVGREDLQPLETFINELSAIKNMSVFYHCGETNWYGSTDHNLIDAVLLGAKRLGHAYALLKHPNVMKIVKNNEIAIEVNPISNQVLKLNEDFRNHPAAMMIANNYPVVISSDDPGIWGALPLAHDMFVTFSYIASRNADIRLLKQLAINSLQYSSLNATEKGEALEKFNEKWTNFINGY